MGLTWVCYYKTELKRQSMKLKHRLSSKEKVLGAAVSKGQADSVLRHEKTHHYCFP